MHPSRSTSSKDKTKNAPVHGAPKDPRRGVLAFPNNYSSVASTSATNRPGSSRRNEATTWKTEVAGMAVPNQTQRDAMHHALDVLFPCP